MNLDDLEILNLHASGGMAEVFRARIVDDDGRERFLAVKKILPQFTRDKDVLRMFVEEARVAACLDHPNVVRVYDLCVGDSPEPSAAGTVGKGGAYYIVMEFADGKDLSDVIWEAVQHRQRLPLGMTVQAARDVARALHHAWNAVDENGVQLKLIHRDISPHNVLVTWDGRIKLTDFGIAKVQASATKTQMGVIKGKFGYMSPEQARAKPLDQRSDLYNVGILLFEAFTGERLFGGATDVDTLEQMRAAKIPRLDPALMIPAPLEAFMRRVLEKDPNLRPPDAATFEAELLAAAEKSRVVPRPNETAHVMAQLFPQLARAAAAPVVQGSARLNLKSQLWGPDFAAAAKAQAAARPGVAVQAAGRASALPLSSSPAPSAPAAPSASPPPPPVLTTSPRPPPAPPVLPPVSPPVSPAAPTPSPRSPPTPRVTPLPADDQAAPAPPAVVSGGRAAPLSSSPASARSSTVSGQAAGPAAVSPLPGPLPPTTSSSSMPSVGRGAVSAGGKAAALPADDMLPTSGPGAVRVGGGARALDSAVPASSSTRERVAAESATRVELSPLGAARAPAPPFGAPLPPTLQPEPPLAPWTPPSVPVPVPAPGGPPFVRVDGGPRPGLAPLPPPPPVLAPAPPASAFVPPWGAPAASLPPPAASAPPPWSPPPPAPPPHAPPPGPATSQWGQAAGSSWGAPLLGDAHVGHAHAAQLPQAPLHAANGPALHTHHGPSGPPPAASAPPSWSPPPVPFAMAPLPPPPPPASPAVARSFAAPLAPVGTPLPPPPVVAPAPPPPASLGPASPGPASFEPPSPLPSVVVPAGTPLPAPVSAESGFVGDDIGDGDVGVVLVTPAMPASPAATPLRRSAREVARAMFVERWLPRGVRIASVVLAVVGVGAGLVGGVLAQAERARQQALSMRALVVRTVPGGASVVLDGRRLDGVTPLAIDVALADGPHTVQLALGARDAVERKIALSPQDRFVLVSETLQSAGRVIVDTRPAGARVLLDGRDVGRAPVTLDGVGTDKPHVVEARLSGYRTATATLPIDRGADHAVTLALESTGTPGRLVVMAAAPGDVSVDGVPWGPTSTTIDDARACAAGRHEVVVSMPALGERAVMTVDVPERGVAKVLAGF